MKPEDVTIIIPHFGATPEQCYALNNCFLSLRRTAPSVPVLVAKNGPIACRCVRHIRVLAQGQCKAVNAAVATTNTPYIFISNDDMIYSEGWFERLTDIIHPCLSPKLIEPVDGAPTFEKFFAGGAGGDFNVKTWEEFVKRYYERPVDERGVRFGFNFPVLIKRDLWDMIGGYDINYDPWGSNGDSDLEYKIRLAGVQPIQTKNVIVYHFSQTSGTFEPRNREYWQQNWEYFKKKWGFYRTDDGIWEATFHMPQPSEGRIFRPAWENQYGN